MKGTPSVTRSENDGDLAFDVTNDNLYIFRNNEYELTAQKLYTAYASRVTNVTEEGLAPITTDVIGFSTNPNTAAGEALTWRGALLTSTLSDAADVTKYVWTNVKGEDGEKGLAGVNGGFRLFQYQNAQTQPTTPVGGSYQESTGSLNPSSGWAVLSSPPSGSDNTYESFANFNPTPPGTDQEEQGFFDISGTPGTDVEGTKESMTISGTNGQAGVITVTPAVSETTQLAVTGTQAGNDATAVAGATENTDVSFGGIGAAEAYFA